LPTQPDSPVIPRRPRRMLMIACAFPPTGGPGVQRSAKFAKYLPRFGWEPVIWSGTGLDQLPHDETLRADLPDDLRHYSRPAWSHTRAHGHAIRLIRQLHLDAIVGKRLGRAADWRLLRLLEGMSSCMVPDDQLPWILRSLGPLLRLVRRERIDVVFSTYSPVANHVLGLCLRWMSGRPWVADFRDLWTDNYTYAKPGPVRRAIDRCVEQVILTAADAVSAVTPEQTRILSAHVPAQAGKFTCVTNGVDLEDFERVDRRRARATWHGPADRFVLTFTGRLRSTLVSDGLVRGIGRFFRQIPSQDQRFELRVVGDVSDDLLAQFVQAGVPTRATGYVPHDRAIGEMVSADALLLLAPHGPNAHTGLTAKVFEYLAAARPILFVGPGQSEVCQLVDRGRAGVRADDDAAAVQAALTELWRRWESGALSSGCASDRLRPFTREHLAKRLAGVLDRVHRGQRRRTGSATEPPLVRARHRGQETARVADPIP
jgi:glycosyltransferase involved in cell wall biosynthesis